MNIDGGCHCGQIKYRAEVDPEKVEICLSAVSLDRNSRNRYSWGYKA